MDTREIYPESLDEIAEYEKMYKKKEEKTMSISKQEKEGYLKEMERLKRDAWEHLETLEKLYSRQVELVGIANDVQAALTPLVSEMVSVSNTLTAIVRRYKEFENSVRISEEDDINIQ